MGCFLYVYFLIPELKGLSLEQVDELYVQFRFCANFQDLRRRFHLVIVLLGFLHEVIEGLITNSKICSRERLKSRQVSLIEKMFRRYKKKLVHSIISFISHLYKILGHEPEICRGEN